MSCTQKWNSVSKVWSQLLLRNHFATVYATFICVQSITNNCMLFHLISWKQLSFTRNRFHVITKQVGVSKMTDICFTSIGEHIITIGLNGWGNIHVMNYQVYWINYLFYGYDSFLDGYDVTPTGYHDMIYTMDIHVSKS